MTTAVDHTIDRYWGRSPTVAALIYVALVAVLVFTAWSAVENVIERRQALRAAGDLLAQLEGRRTSATTRSGLPAGPVPEGSPFLEGETLTVAGAALLQRVAMAVGRAGGTIQSSQVDVQGVQAKAGFVSLVVSCELDQPALQQLLYDLEAGMPFLFIDQLVAQAPVPSTVSEGGRMRVLLGVTGQWQGGAQ
jgi:general secretion pathway protein M